MDLRSCSWSRSLLSFLLETKYPFVLEPALVPKPSVLLPPSLHVEWVCTDVPFPFDTLDGLQPYVAAEHENPIGTGAKVTGTGTNANGAGAKVRGTGANANGTGAKANGTGANGTVPPIFSVVLHRTQTRLS